MIITYFRYHSYLTLPLKRSSHWIKEEMAKLDVRNPPEASALTKSIQSDTESLIHDSRYHHLVSQVKHDLQYQHEWSSLTVHTRAACPTGSNAETFPRPLLSGLAPRHLYTHPDDQLEMLKREIKEKDVPVQREWVLPTHLREKWSLRKFAQIFDAIEAVPPNPADAEDEDGPEISWIRKRQKRCLLAVVSDDSTIVYYIIHDGIVKPRQN